MIFKKFLNLLNQVKTKVFYIYKVIEIIIISKYNRPTSEY